MKTEKVPWDVGQDEIVARVAWGLGCERKEKGDAKTYFLAARAGIRLLFQGHSQRGATKSDCVTLSAGCAVYVYYFKDIRQGTL